MACFILSPCFVGSADDFMIFPCMADEDDGAGASRGKGGRLYDVRRVHLSLKRSLTTVDGDDATVARCVARGEGLI